jgi:hypothetical protein
MIRLWSALQDPDNPLTKVSQSFKEYSQGQGTLAIVVAAAFLIIILAAIFTSLISARRGSAHWRTFREFAEASGLTAQETKLLIFVAERAQPDNPVALFVKRSVFETAVQDLGIDVPRAGILRRKVYGP